MRDFEVDVFTLDDFVVLILLLVGVDRVVLLVDVLGLVVLV